MAAGLLQLLVLSQFSISVGGCVTKDTSGEVADLPDKPLYASPWDKPIARIHGPQTTETIDAPRRDAVADLLGRAGIASAGTRPGSSGASSKPALSPWDPPDRLPTADADSVPVDTAGSKDWSIGLASYNRETEAGVAQQMLGRIKALPGMSGVYMETRGRSLVVAYGRYDAPGSPAAQNDLARIRDITMEGTKPFHHAVMTPPAAEIRAGAHPEFELRNARRVHGKDAIYTLQIAVYWRSDGEEPSAKELAEFRAAAEQAAADLRREGEEAYYSHGPRKSMVTVGVFNDTEYDVTPLKKNPLAVPNQSARLLGLRAKYPYNLENGRAVRRTHAGANKGRIDPSFIVMIPD